jgi:hypothetical protein
MQATQKSPFLQCRKKLVLLRLALYALNSTLYTLLQKISKRIVFVMKEPVQALMQACALCNQRAALLHSIAQEEEKLPAHFLDDATFKRRYYAQHGNAFVAGLCFVLGFLAPTPVIVWLFPYFQGGFAALAVVLCTIGCAFAGRQVYIWLFLAQHGQALKDYHKFKEAALPALPWTEQTIDGLRAELATLESSMRQPHAQCIPEEYWHFSPIIEEFVRKGKAKTWEEVKECLKHDQRYVQSPQRKAMDQEQRL